MEYVAKRILEATRIFSYKTKKYKYINIEKITADIINEIHEKGAFLIVGNEVKLPSRYKIIEFVDFVYEEYIGKKIVILYGNCHTGAVKKYLQSCEDFNAEYVIYPLKEIQDVKEVAYFEKPVIRICDVLIHQSIWENNRYGKEYASSSIIARVKRGCRIIAMPNLYHMPTFLFPQYYEAKELRYKNQTYFFRDLIIDEGIKKGKSLKQIAGEYYYYEFDKQMIRDKYKLFLEKIEKREKDWDISVADYIDDNIRKVPLFYEPNHPTSFLIEYYASNIIHILFGRYKQMTNKDNWQMDMYQMPFLPEVSTALNTCYSTKGNVIRETGIKLKRGKMGIQEYVNQYYACIWICGEYGKKNQIFSKILWECYKIQDLFIKILNRIKAFLLDV